MSNVKEATKSAYSQPKLAVYGGFAQLTAAGSSGNAEGNAMVNLMRFA